MNYRSSGQGPAVVFLHGFTGSHEDWRYQMSVINARFHAIALDFRGHGETDAPENEEDYSIYHNVADVRQVLTGLRIEKCCMVGHSMGGFTALQYAVDFPEMLWGLVLVDTASGQWDMAPGYAALRAKLDELARTQGLEAAFTYDSENNPVRIERYKQDPAQKEIARKKTLNTAVSAYINVPRSFGKWQPVTRLLQKINVPTLIICGENDTAFLNPSSVMKDCIEGSRLVVVPGAYHNPHEETPQFFNEHFMAFLSKAAPE